MNADHTPGTMSEKGDCLKAAMDVFVPSEHTLQQEKWLQMNTESGVLQVMNPRVHKPTNQPGLRG